MRSIGMALIALWLLTGCAGMYVAGDVGAGSERAPATSQPSQ